MSGSIKTVVIGGTGYVAGEILRLIAGHPDFEFAAAASDSQAGKPIAATFPHLASAYPDSCYVDREGWISELKPGDRLALFSAAPHGASAAGIASALEQADALEVVTHVVDASADFRFASQVDYEAVYGPGHGAPQLLPVFSSGVPEHVRGAPTQHVGHPGCFATATLLATVPLLQSDCTDDEFFVTAITGSTGSGRSPQPGTHHPERHSNLYAYKPLEHRHAPEIEKLAQAASGRETLVRFVPHSGPYARGIHATVQARATRKVSAGELAEVFRTTYANAPFVNVVEGTPRLKSVVASNYCEIGVASSGDSVVVMSVIDNLVKGAAGGAVQWMNRLWNLPETSGLTTAAPGWS